MYARNKRAVFNKGDEEAEGRNATRTGLQDVMMRPPDLNHLEALDPDVVEPRAVGQPKAYPEPVFKALKAYKLPRPVEQFHRLSPRPAAVVRDATVQIAQALDEASKSSSREMRYLLGKSCSIPFGIPLPLTIALTAGPQGVGKSILLLQAASYAQSKGWVVLYIPEATRLVDSSAPYSYSSKHALFEQPTLALDLLNRWSSGNAEAFKTLKTSKDWAFGDVKVAQGKPLVDLAKAVSRDEKIPTLVLEAVMEELTAQKQKPVLLAADECEGLFVRTKYVDPSYRKLEPFHLVIPRMLLDFMAGLRQFASGAIVYAHSFAGLPHAPALQDFVKPRVDSTRHDPYPSVYDRANSPNYPIYQEVLRSGVHRFNVPTRLSKEEAAGIVELVRAFRGNREAVDDQAFLEHYVTSDANAGLFFRSLSRNLII
ncbi:mitochondrial carrier protein [Rhodotorula toruloides]|uniref:Small ribosomal subunit protein mS29 n=1 Tax=Rhodotorula toruloides TaxID=5286 RepID=A0A511KB71_RHOTO|nr:mitochondrial carrier protein [Rhodotorula toruloides]